MRILSPEEALGWVERNAKKILGHTRRYLPFAPYDQEDFLQDAYEAALFAAKVSAERQVPFPACFWITFKGQISEVTPHPASDRHAGSPSPPSTVCYSTDFSEWGIEPSEPDFDIDRLFRIIQKHLTPLEGKVLEQALGIRDGRKTLREIAQKLECSQANVRQALDRVYRRLSSLVQSGQLQIHPEDVEFQVHASTLATMVNHRQAKP